MDSSFIYLVILSIFAFLCGSIPTGLVVAHLYGVDIRSVGSGNIGATNVLRCVGKKAGYTTFLVDMIKGIFPLIVANFVLGKYAIDAVAYLPVVGLSAMLGHCFSPLLKGKGGKGVATGFAVFLYLFPLGALLAIGVFVVVFYVSRYVSLGSVLSSLSLLIASFVLSSDRILQMVIFIAIFVIVIKHIPNIKRLLKGEESRFGSSKKAL